MLKRTEFLHHVRASAIPLRLRAARANALLDRVRVLVLAHVSAVALATFRHYGLGWDDYTHAQMGEKLLALYGSGFREPEALSFVNLYMYGGGFDMLAALAAKVLAVRRCSRPGASSARWSASLGLFAVTWRIGRRVGGPLAGLIALVLLATCPIFYGHMFINAKDAPFAVGDGGSAARPRPRRGGVSAPHARDRDAVRLRRSASRSARASWA